MNNKSRNPKFKEYIIEKLQRQFFMKHIDLELIEIKEGEVRARLNVEEKHLQQNYILHGGVISTGVDIVMGFSAYSLVAEGFGVVTATLSVDFLRPGKAQSVEFIGKVLKPGKNLYFCEADVIGNDGVHIASARSTMAVIKI